MQLKAIPFYLFFIVVFLSFTSCKKKNSTNPTQNNLAKKTSNTSDEKESYKRYEIESGIIHFTIESAQISGTETLYFVDYGRKETKITTHNVGIMGFKQTTNTMTIMDGEWMTTIDLDKKTGNKHKPQILQELTDGAKTNDLGYIGQEMLEKMGEKIGIETILDKKTDKYKIESMGTLVWVWKGIAIKTVTEMMGLNMKMTATKIDLTSEISASTFEPPADVTISDKDPMEELKKYKDLMGGN